VPAPVQGERREGDTQIAKAVEKGHALSLQKAKEKITRVFLAVRVRR